MGGRFGKYGDIKRKARIRRIEPLTKKHGGLRNEHSKKKKEKRLIQKHEMP